VSGKPHTPTVLKINITPCVGVRVNPRAGLDVLEKRIILCTCRDSNPGHSARKRLISTSIFHLVTVAATAAAVDIVNVVVVVVVVVGLKRP